MCIYFAFVKVNKNEHLLHAPRLEHGRSFPSSTFLPLRDYCFDFSEGHLRLSYTHNQGSMQAFSVAKSEPHFLSGEELLSTLEVVLVERLIGRWCCVHSPRVHRVFAHSWVLFPVTL